jgi:hypothetical protein
LRRRNEKAVSWLGFFFSKFPTQRNREQQSPIRNYFCGAGNLRGGSEKSVIRHTHWGIRSLDPNGAGSWHHRPGLASRPGPRTTAQKDLSTAAGPGRPLRAPPPLSEFLAGTAGPAPKLTFTRKLLPYELLDKLPCNFISFINSTNCMMDLLPKL